MAAAANRGYDACVLTESEIFVRDAIRELYEGHITGEEIEIDGSIKYLILHFGSGNGKLVVKLSKLTRLYESGTSLAAIKTASQFDLTDPSRLPWGN
jgi:hypothetical protein